MVSHGNLVLWAFNSYWELIWKMFLIWHSGNFSSVIQNENEDYLLYSEKCRLLEIAIKTKIEINDLPETKHTLSVYILIVYTCRPIFSKNV